MFVLIVGGGRTGVQLGLLLLQQGHDIKIVDNRREVLNRIHREIPTQCIYEGNPLDPQVLKLAGIERANALVASLKDDATNLVVCYLARTVFRVPRIIARINNPRNAWLYRSRQFHTDVSLDQSDILAHLVAEEMSLGDMMTLLKLRRGRYSLIEEKIPPGARGSGRAIRDLNLPEQCIIATIIRQGKVILPRGDTVLQPEDEVLAITDESGARYLATLFAPPERAAESRPAQGF
jgi:trk system potassium uptake protein TrkA